MQWKIRKCPQCKSYTLRELCPYCNTKTISPHPPRFSPEDRYVEYRVKMKYSDLIKELEKIKRIPDTN